MTSSTKLAWAFSPLLNLVDSNDKPLVHVVCRIACLRLLCDLSLPYELVNGHLLVTGSGASSRTMGCCRDGKPVWELDISIAAQAGKHRWMISIDVGLVARGPHGMPIMLRFSRTRHVHVLGQVGGRSGSNSSVSQPSRGKPLLHLLGSLASLQWLRGRRSPAGPVGKCTWCCFLFWSSSTSLER